MIVVIGAILTLITPIIVGLWRKFGRISAEKRKIADEAEGMLEDAQKTKSKSGRLDAWMRMRRLR